MRSSSKVGGYVLGNLVISLIAGTLTFTFLAIFGVPYALLLSIFVAIPGSGPGDRLHHRRRGGLPGRIECVAARLPGHDRVFVVYRLVEDYLLVPRIIGRAVEVPALLTVVAVLVGGALLGIVGALVAIPAAAALLLLTPEMLFPRLDRT